MHLSRGAQPQRAHKLLAPESSDIRRQSVVSRASPLREIIKKRFYPFAESRKFVRQKSQHPLFTEFLRTNETDIHAFEIQWDKHHRPYFVINFGKADVETELKLNSGRLQRRRGGSLRYCWFSLRRPWRSRLATGRWKYSPEEVVTEVIDAFDELESWWADGSTGPHLEVWSQ